MLLVALCSSVMPSELCYLSEGTQSHHCTPGNSHSSQDKAYHSTPDKWAFHFLDKENNISPCG
jgi:hypothetical protein